MFKKKLNRLQERLTIKNKKAQPELTLKAYKKQSKKLLSILEKSPANFTIGSDFDCMTYGYALRDYFEMYQSNHSIRALISMNDDSMPLEEDLIEKKIEYFRCIPQLKVDISFYHYFKYLVESFRLMATNDATTKPELSIINIAQLFSPFIELNDRFEHVLTSHSYLLYILQNYEKLFSKTEPCGNESQVVKDEKKKEMEIWKIE